MKLYYTMIKIHENTYGSCLSSRDQDMLNMLFVQEYISGFYDTSTMLYMYINILKYNFIVAILQYITYFMYTAIVIII